MSALRVSSRNSSDRVLSKAERMTGSLEWIARSSGSIVTRTETWTLASWALQSAAAQTKHALAMIILNVAATSMDQVVRA